MFFRKQWEYYCFNDETSLKSTVEKSLNDLGSMGNELFSVIRNEKGNYSEYYLKRVKWEW